MTKFVFGEFSADIDAADADFMELYETETEKLSNDVSEAEKEGTASVVIRNTCRCVFAFFNALFGEGTDRAMFGNRTNARICDDAMVALSDAITADMEDYAKSAREKAAIIRKSIPKKQTAKKK